MQKATSVKLWEGVASKEARQTVVTGWADEVTIYQAGHNPYNAEYVVLCKEQAVDIAMAILKDCTPTLHEMILDAFGTSAKHTG